MLESFDWKLATAIAASVVYIIGIIPYYRDIFARKTKPHIYTWLIWMLTQGTAAAAIVTSGGGVFASTAVIIGVIVISTVFLLSFHYGTKNITKVDTTALIAALAAILIWWQLDNPVLAIVMVSVIDALGYFPTFRKSYFEPWSETAVSWLLSVVAVFLVILSLEEYNILTVTYIGTIFAANTLLYILLITRRKFVPKPQ